MQGPSVAEQRSELAGAPAPLAALHKQAGQLLDGGAEAFRARRERLKGYPLVVNLWGAWCGPCRHELPFFQRQALKQGRRIAFLGVDVNDSDSEARKLLKEIPLSYPSYSDPDSEIAQGEFRAVAFPTTIFIDSAGRVAYKRIGVYSSEQRLASEIARYTR